MAYTCVYAILSTLVDLRKANHSRPRRLHICLRQVLPFKQERLSFGLRQCVGEAISKIQFGGVAAGFAEIAIGLARYASLRFRDRLNRDLRFLDQIIDTGANRFKQNPPGAKSCQVFRRTGPAPLYR